ncbi:MAG: hypothetical protein E7112_06315 [Bacteroidales bacterium]|nr:hypothetical protein [Bacteroidales bacterium]
MKRFILIIASAAAMMAAGAPEVGAQEKAEKHFRYEFRLGLGGYPESDHDNFTSLRSGSFYLRDTSFKNLFDDYDGPTYMTGNIMASFGVHVGKRLTLSLGLAANGMWKDQYDVFTDRKTGRVTGCVVTVLPQIRFDWISQDALRLYSSLGLGTTRGSFDGRSDRYLAGQAVFLGITVGRRFIVFAECGSGSLYKGGMGGFGYRF